MNQDNIALAHWAESLAKHHHKLACEPERVRSSRRANEFKAKQLRRIAEVLRGKSDNQHRGA